MAVIRGLPQRGSDPKAAPGQSSDPEASAQLRDRLLAELKDLGSSDDAAIWAHRSLGEKNKLTAPDALRVEESFQARLTTLTTSAEASPDATSAARSASARHDGPTQGKRKVAPRTKTVDKTALALPEPRRVRDRDHVRSVAKRPCLICGRQPSDAHHLRFAQSRALGRKVSDEFTVPLCRGHHREVHRCGDEATWWRSAGVDPVALPARCGSKRIRCRQSRKIPEGHSHSRYRQSPENTPRPTGRRTAEKAKLQNEANCRGSRSMTSFLPDRGNRRNARNSTGPKTEADGKQRSRRNAVRHGLTAETVIDILEDPEDYKAFELSVTSDFDAQSAVERELVLRLASLLWRLRRATSIETGMLQIQAGHHPRGRAGTLDAKHGSRTPAATPVFGW